MSSTIFFFVSIIVIAPIAIAISLTSPPDYDPISILIDCGGSSNFTSPATNRTWLADRFFSSGAPGVVAEPHAFAEPQQRTLRFFPPSTSGPRNCYSIPIPSPLRFHLRLFTVYDNYDSKLLTPSFDVSLGPTLLFSWRSPWPSPAPRLGAFSDLFASASSDPSLRLCFRSVSGDAPVVSSIELFAIHPLSYSALDFPSVVLVNYGRLSSGSGILLDDDRFARIWQSDANFLSPASRSRAYSISTDRSILGTDLPPNHFPMRLYQSATVSRSPIEYLLDVDAEFDYLLWLHFAEIDPAVSAVGERVFDVVIGGRNVTRIDVYRQVGGFAAFKMQYVARNVSGVSLVVRLLPVVGGALVCGIENYAMVGEEKGTLDDEMEAMLALKESLGVPERMGWNGDPCAPRSWDAWEGVTCSNVEGVGQVIIGLDLSSQGLKGYISEKMGLLSNLVSLNMSFNSIKGHLPPGINQASLVRLDLSGNKLSGSIPDSFGSSNMQLVLLNDNELEGQVPEKLYSVGVHGGEIECHHCGLQMDAQLKRLAHSSLSGNKALCGVPSLPPCPFFWQKRDLSTRGKITIGLVALAFLCLVILFSYALCRRRGRNGYNFAYSDELASVAAIKQPRYRRHKSLMQLEMEAQHAKGFPASLTPF